MLVEITFMFIIILGRWILPKGDVSHSALSQLLLVYLSLASDILDLLTLFNENEIQISRPMVRLVLFVFSFCMLQFALNLTATRGRAFRAEFDQTEIEIHQSAPPRRRQLLSKIFSRPRANSLAELSAPQLESLHMKTLPMVVNICPPDTIFENPQVTADQETPKHSSN